MRIGVASHPLLLAAFAVAAMAVAAAAALSALRPITAIGLVELVIER